MEIFLKYDVSINIIQILAPSRYQTSYQNHLYSIPFFLPVAAGLFQPTKGIVGDFHPGDLPAP